MPIVNSVFVKYSSYIYTFTESDDYVVNLLGLTQFLQVASARILVNYTHIADYCFTISQ